MKNILKYLVFGFIGILLIKCQAPVKNNWVEIKEENDKYILYRNGEPYYIKGAVAHEKLDLIKKYGGNSVRMWRPDSVKLQQAQEQDLSVLYGLPVRAERDGMDYDNEQAVKEQFDNVMDQVREFKTNPAILIWQLGNELDFIAHLVDPNWKVFDEVNKLAEAIHIEDPSRPVTTVVGTGNWKKLKIIIEKCPAIDILGINTYADIEEVRTWIDTSGWTKPYFYTEWGPSGFWQVQGTEWDVPIEETSSEKAIVYQERYEKYILGEKDKCMGSYVFLWQQHQELTHTWFGMFDEKWRESAAVDVMQYEWTGNWPVNRAPELISMFIEDKKATDNIYLKPDKIYKARVIASDRDGDDLTYHWEVLPEPEKFGYGGRGEVKPDSMAVIQSAKNSSEIRFRGPREENSYRLFVYIYDGNNHFATANIPFYIRP